MAYELWCLTKRDNSKT